LAKDGFGMADTHFLPERDFQKKYWQSDALFPGSVIRHIKNKKNMLKGAIIGLGKMGISHASIVNAHLEVELVAVCDTSALLTGAFGKYTSIQTYSDSKRLMDEMKPDFIVVALPTKFHYTVVKAAIERGIHVFCEKPLVLHSAEGEELVRMANEKRLANQVGYHNHFIGTFIELKKLLKENILGRLFHFTGEAYGPVVVKPKTGNWRSKPEEGGGCLYDYASHVLNLIQEIIGRPVEIQGVQMKKFYSSDVEDAVYALMELKTGVSGVMQVNWSDETYRKMSTSLTIQGEKGKIICDATELKVYLKEACPELGYDKGWTIKYITDLAVPVNFYLRGEEYSAQIDYFIKSIQGGTCEINTFEQGLYTERVIEMIIENSKK
jgi:predicted dehydrogenase